VRARRGFVLLAVLWFITGASALGLGVALTGRQATTAAFNRMALTRAAWDAEACLAAARAAIAEVMRGDDSTLDSLSRTWAGLAAPVLASPLVLNCPGEIEFLPTGGLLDINAASGEAVQAVLVSAGVAEARAAAMSAAFLDWRDADAVPRELGAERDWYEAQERAVPRDGPLASIRELPRVRGFETSSESRGDAATRRPLDSLFTVEPGRAGAEPEAWILTARAFGAQGADGTPRLESTIEVRLIRGGRNVAITRQRSGP
jgi:type II secretory pathway component PulK